MSEDPVSRAQLVVLISGGGSNLQSILDACERGALDARVALVISNREDAYGLERARMAGVPSAVIRHDIGPDRARFEQQLIKAIDPVNPDYIILAGFMRILSARFVARYPNRILNIHPSLLPAYKGTDTHQRVLDAGESEHGASVHLVTAELDGGPVVSQIRVPVKPGDTAETLAARVLEQEHQLYPEAIQKLIEGRVIATGGQLEFRDNP